MYTISKKSFCQLKERARAILPAKLKELKNVKEQYGEKKLGDIKVSQVIGEA
jgi:hypothetical protein